MKVKVPVKVTHRNFVSREPIVHLIVHALDWRFRISAILKNILAKNSQKKRSEKKKDEENFTDSVFVTGGLQVPVNTTPGVSSNHTDYTLRAGGQRVPVINSPADIYKYFPRKANYGETSPDEEISRSRSISPEIAEPRIPSDSSDKDSVNSSNMEGEYIRALNELTQKLLTRDININKFHGRENDDVNRWFEKLELILESKGIRLTDSAARTQLINHLAGPAETFMFELAPEERRDFDTLKQALVRRYSTKDRTWVKRQRLVARCQGPNELLSDYINDMHELFSGLNMAEIDKVTYFTEGLLQPLKDKVLERMPETLLQAEEVARTIDSISNRSRQNKGSDQVERLIEALNRNQQVPAIIPGTSAVSNSAQQQSLRAKMDTLTERLDNIMVTQPKENKIAAYSETDKDGQPALMKRMQEMEYQITRLSRQMDARINGIVRRASGERVTQQRTRDGRPICYYCRAVGHFQNSCPQRAYNSQERGPLPRNALPAPERYEHNRYQSGLQPRSRALGPPGRQNRVAALTEGFPEPDEEYMAPVLDQDGMESYFLEDSEDVYSGDWDDYYEHLPEDDEYYEPIKQPKMNILSCFTGRKAVKTLPAASHDPEPEVDPEEQLVDTFKPNGNVAMEYRQITSVPQKSVTSDPEDQLVAVEETDNADPAVQVARDVPPPNAVVHTGTMITPEIISPENADVAAYIIPPPPEFADFRERADIADYIIPPPPEFIDSLENADMGDDTLPPPPEFVDCLENADMGDDISPPPPEFADFSETAASMHDPSVAQTRSEQIAGAEEFKEVSTTEQLNPTFYHPVTSTPSQSLCAHEFNDTKTAELLAPAENKFVDTQFSKSAISGALPPKTEIVDRAWKQAPPVNFMPMEENTEQPTEKVCAFPAQNQQLGIIKYIQELSDKMENLEQHIDAQINKVVRHNQNSRYKRLPTRKVQTICFSCGVPGHYQYNCPQNAYHNSSSSEKSVVQRPSSPAIASQKVRCNPSHQLPNMQEKQPEKPKLPEPTKKDNSKRMTFTILQTTEGEKKTVKQKVTSRNKEQDLPPQVPQSGKLQVEKAPCSQTSHPFSAEDTPAEFEDWKSPLMICGELEGQPVELLIDTGACVSAIDEKLVKNIYGHYPKQMTDGVVPSVNTINGERIPVLGKIEIPVKLNGVVYHSQFHVMLDLPYEVILGQDFLLKNNAVIDLRNKCLTLASDSSSKLKKTPTPLLKSKHVMATYISPSSKKETSYLKKPSHDEQKTNHDQQVPRPQKVTQRGSVHVSFTSSFWILILVVLYLCLTSHAQIVEKLQPVKKMISKECYSVKQIQVQAQRKLSISPRHHDEESTTRIFSQNWNDPYNAAELKSISPNLHDIQLKSSLCVPFQENEDKRTTKEGKAPENKDVVSFVRGPEIIHSLPKYKFIEL